MKPVYYLKCGCGIFGINGIGNFEKIVSSEKSRAGADSGDGYFRCAAGTLVENGKRIAKRAVGNSCNKKRGVIVKAYAFVCGNLLKACANILRGDSSEVKALTS